MSIEKAIVKMGTAHDIGCRLDDTREAYLKEVSHWEGANAGALQIARGVEDLGKHVDRDVDEGKYDFATATLIKKYLTRAATVAQAVAAQASQQNLMARGKVQAMEASITLVQKIHAEEKGRVDAYREAVASGKIRVEDDESPPGEHVPGARPSLSIKEQRLAEEQAALPPAEDPPVPPEKKRGGRGKRAADT